MENRDPPIPEVSIKINSEDNEKKTEDNEKKSEDYKSIVTSSSPNEPPKETVSKPLSLIDIIEHMKERIHKGTTNEIKSFEYVEAKEFEVLLKRRQFFKEPQIDHKTFPFKSDDPRSIGVAFSGGGIRSCAYCLGALKGLKNSKFLPNVDYLSTVSGGGFAGAAYISHLHFDQSKTIESAVDHLYERSKKNCGYLIDRRIFWKTPIDVLAAILVALMIFVLGKSPALILTLFPLSVWIDHIIGDKIRSSINNNELPYELQLPFLIIPIICFVFLMTSRQIRLGTNDWRIWLSTTIVRGIFVQIAFWHSCLIGVWFLYKFSLLDSQFGWDFFIFFFSMIAYFSLIHIYPINLLFLSGPIIIGYTVSLTWFFRIYWWYQVDWSWITENDGFRFNLLWLIAFLLLHIFNSSGKKSGILQNYFHFRLSRAFSDPDHLSSKNEYFLSKSVAERVCEKKGGPYLLCNVTINNYRKVPSDRKWNHFLFSPLYSGSDLVGYTESENLQKTISEAMALSGAVFSTRMGKYTVENLSSNEYFLNLLGYGMGDLVSFPYVPSKLSSAFLIPHISQVVFLILVSLGVFLSPYNGSTSWLIFIAYCIYLFFFSLNLFNFKYSDGSYVFNWKLMAETYRIVGVDTLGPTPPPLLNLTDGGHLDNLGLIPLLKRECKLILSFDAGLDITCRCDELIEIIESHSKQGFKFMAENPDPQKEQNHLNLFDIKRKKKRINSCDSSNIYLEKSFRRISFSDSDHLSNKKKRGFALHQT